MDDTIVQSSSAPLADKRLTVLIRVGFDIQFQIPSEVAMVALLNVHPSRVPDLLEPDELQTAPAVPVTYYTDGAGNRCSRFVAPAGVMKLTNSTLVRCAEEPDEVNLSARELAVKDLPNDVLVYL